MGNLVKQLNKKHFKYSTLKEILIAEIQRGNFKEGEAFYTERELMKRHNMSYVTVSRALREMKEEGFFTGIRGHGTFINKKALIGVAKKQEALYEPLYLIGEKIEKFRIRSPQSWFVYDQIQKGIINSYHGPVRITEISDIREKLGKHENTDCVLINPEPDIISELRKKNCRCVAINHRRYRDAVFNLNSISWEMLAGIYELMSYLIRDMGHRKIAFIGGDNPEYHADRFAGYQIGLKTHNIPERCEYIIRDVPPDEKSGYDAMTRLLSLPDPPTAVFVDTDVKATGAIKAATDAGLAAPEDISIAGFDDMPGAEDIIPPLTTVKIPYYEIGSHAVQMLSEMKKNTKDIPCQILKSTLLVRNSCEKNKHADKKITGRAK